MMQLEHKATCHSVDILSTEPGTAMAHSEEENVPSARLWQHLTDRQTDIEGTTVLEPLWDGLRARHCC